MKPILVTKCCGSPRWHHALNETKGIGVDYCYDCEKFEPDNVRPATKEEETELLSGGLDYLMAELIKKSEILSGRKVKK
jgi:hypothetical protein